MSNSTILRKGTALAFSLILLFVLTSCRDGNTAIANPSNEKVSVIELNEADVIEAVNILELNEADVVKAMDFDRYVVSLLYNTNAEEPINRTVDVYGVFLTENDCDTVKSALTNRFSEVNLYSNGEKIITAKEYSVDAVDVEDGVLFTLHLVADRIPHDTQTLDIEKIEFVYSSGTTVRTKTSSFCLTIYREEQNKTNIIESPMMNAVAIAKNEFLRVGYLFLCANIDAKDDFDVSFLIPQNIESAVEVSLEGIEKDEEMTETALSVSYFELTPEQRDSLNVYRISVSFAKTEDKGVIVQLLFATDILGEQQYMGAFCPLMIR